MARCEQCGWNIPDGEEIAETRTESQGLPGTWGSLGSTTGDLFYLCRGCAKRKNRFWNILVIMFLVVPVVICVISVITSYF
jgi:hypothetical protein